MGEEMCFLPWNKVWRMIQRHLFLPVMMLWSNRGAGRISCTVALVGELNLCPCVLHAGGRQEEAGADDGVEACIDAVVK